MCFCATGSFAASGALAVAGAVALSVAQNEELMLAAIPLIFAVQQALEGFQWLVPHPGPSSLALGYGYLFFAYLLWPVYLPLTVFRVERNRKRRRILVWFVGLGVFCSLALLLMMTVQPLSIRFYPQGIAYLFDVPLGWFGAAVYLVATCGSLLVSSRRSLQWFGVSAFVSALFAFIIFQQTFTSVWCFFSAILSLMILFIVKRKKSRRSKHISKKSYDH